MSPSGIPTGTLGDERLGSKTRARAPDETREPDESPLSPTISGTTSESSTTNGSDLRKRAQESNSTDRVGTGKPSSEATTESRSDLRAERDELRREIERLRNRNEHLQNERSRIRDRYERILDGGEHRDDPPRHHRADRTPSERIVDGFRLGVRRLRDWIAR